MPFLPIVAANYTTTDAICFAYLSTHALVGPTSANPGTNFIAARLVKPNWVEKTLVHLSTRATLVGTGSRSSPVAAGAKSSCLGPTGSNPTSQGHQVQNPYV